MNGINYLKQALTPGENPFIQSVLKESPNPNESSGLQLKIGLTTAITLGLTLGYFGLLEVSAFKVLMDPNIHVKNWNPYIPAWEAVRGPVILFLLTCIGILGLAKSWVKYTKDKTKVVTVGLPFACALAGLANALLLIPLITIGSYLLISIGLLFVSPFVPPVIIILVTLSKSRRNGYVTAVTYLSVPYVAAGVLTSQFFFWIGLIRHISQN